MFNKQNKRQLLALTFNFVIVILECIGFYLSISKYNQLYFKYYTENCNILSLFSSLLFIIFCIINITNRNIKIPLWISRLRYISTCSLSLIFVLVLLTLLPISDETFSQVMLSDSFIYHHGLCPVLCIISFVFLEDYSCDNSSRKETLIACSFTFIYGLIITIFNVLKILKGPYFFFHIYEQPLYSSIAYYVAIIACVCTIAKLLLRCNKTIAKKYALYD